MNDNEQALQAMVEYYRNKCHKLEHDFLVYKIRSDQTIKSLTEQAQTEDKED